MTLPRRQHLTRSKALARGTRRMRRSRYPVKDWRVKSPLGTRARVKEDLHEVVSKIVRLRDMRCVLCGETDWQKLTCGHFYKRGWIGTAFDLRNCNTLCKTCNGRDNYDRNPYLAFMLERYGTEVISELFEMRNSKQHITTVTLEEMLSEYRLQLKPKGR